MDPHIVNQPVVSSVPVQFGKQRVGFLTRAGAAILDGIAILILGSIVGVLFGGALAASLNSGNSDTAVLVGAIGTFFGAIIGIWLISFLNLLLEGFTGTSLGKIIVGIKIGNDKGIRAHVGQLWLRSGVKNIAIVCALLSILSHSKSFGQLGSILGLVVFLGFFATLGSDKKALHDWIAQTAVYHKKDLV